MTPLRFLPLLLCVGLLAEAAGAQQEGTAGVVLPEEEVRSPGAYAGLYGDFLARPVYGYPSMAGDRYIRYGAVNQGRRPVFDRLGQFVSYGSFGLQWNEVRDRYTQDKLDAGVPLTQMHGRSSALIQNSFFNFLAVVRQDYGQEAMSIAMGRNMATTFTPLILNQKHYGGLRVDYASQRHDLTFLLSRGGTLEGTLFSDLRAEEREDREISPVIIGGANWVGHFGALDLGASFFRQLQSNVKAEPMSLWRGDVPYLELRSPKQISLRITDDSPRDLGGAALYDATLLVTAVVDGEERRYTTDSGRAGPDVLFEPGLVRRLPPAGRQVGQHWEADGTERIDVTFEIDPALHTTDARFELEVDGDYRIAVRQAHDFQRPGGTATETRTWPNEQRITTFGQFFKDYLVEEGEVHYYTVRRSPGSPSLDGQPRTVRFRHGIPTAQSFYGANIEMNTRALSLMGELVYNPQDFMYPTRDGRRQRQSAKAGYLTALARFGARGNVGAEIYRLDPTYGGWHDSRRGGLVLFTDVAGDVNQGENLGTEGRMQEFNFYDDNDDHDNIADDFPGSGDLLYIPQGVFNRALYPSRKPDGGVYPGFDMDGDRLVDFDKNRNAVQDWLEPFLGYDAEPPEFDWGVDFNNNLVPDYRENDDAPDYPYRRDQKGMHLFYDVNARPWWLEQARLGWYTAEEVDGGHSADVGYLLLKGGTQSARTWTLFHDELKRVEDDIPDDVYRLVLQPDFLTVDTGTLNQINSRWNQPSRPPPADFLPMRKSVVNTGFFQVGWLPLADLQLINSVKYVLNRRAEVEDGDGQPVQEDETLHNVSLVNKISYERELTPNLRLTGRVKHLLARWDEGSYAPVDSVLVGQEASWSLLTPEVLASYRLTPRTRIEFGQHGLFVPALRSRFTDRQNDDAGYTQSMSLLQLAMSGEYGGYNLVAHVGLRRENTYVKASSGREDTDLTAFFVDVIFGVE